MREADLLQGNPPRMMPAFQQNPREVDCTTEIPHNAFLAKIARFPFRGAGE